MKCIDARASARLFLLLLTSVAAVAQQDSAGQVPADNTKINQRDRNQNEPTADQQKENSSDRELARRVRQALVKDKSLSTDAHNLKIIAENGMVTLKGPVTSAREKQVVEATAAKIAGSDKVSSEIDIAPTTMK